MWTENNKHVLILSLGSSVRDLTEHATLWPDETEILEDECDDQIHLNFRNYVSVTHETKKKILSKVPPEDLKKLRCDNPDIWVAGRNDDTIILTPPGIRRRNEDRPSKRVTNVRAEEILGTNWRKEVPIMKMLTRHEELLEIVCLDPQLTHFINSEIERRNLSETFYIPRRKLLILIFRQRL